MGFSYQRCARILGLVAVSVLGAALGLWALVALVEALAVFVLILIVAALALPHSMGWYWRRARRELARLLLSLGLWLDNTRPKDESAEASPEAPAGAAAPDSSAEAFTEASAASPDSRTRTEIGKEKS